MVAFVAELVLCAMHMSRALIAPALETMYCAIMLIDFVSLYVLFEPLKTM